jgi:hypothetical protein
MADGERSVAADRRKRARQNGVVQPLLTGRFCSDVLFAERVFSDIVRDISINSVLLFCGL